MCIRDRGYIETTAAQEGVSIRITKAKKFPQGVRKSAEGVRTIAASPTRNCGTSNGQSYTHEPVVDGMNSSLIVRMKEREAQRENLSGCGNQHENQKQNRNRNQKPGEYPSPNQNPSGLEQNQNPVSYTHLDVYKRQITNRRLHERCNIGESAGVQ